MTNFTCFISLLIGKPDWKIIRDHLSKEGRVGKDEFIKLINDCSK